MNLYDTLLEKMEGRQYSNYFSCYCPFDQHQSPALLCYDDGMFVCLSCGKKGSLEYLAKKLSISSHSLTRSHSTSPVVLPQWRRWEQEHGDLEGIAKFAHKSLKAFPQFQNYFKHRKIYDFSDMGYFGYISGWIVFPVFDRNRKVVDIIVRGTRHKGNTRYVISPSIVGNARNLYVPNYERVNQAEEVYVVYGICDAWAFEAIGLPCITGCTGKSLSAELLQPLGKRFIIVPDDGEETEAHKLANKLGWRACVKTLRYEDDCKDVDDVRIKFGNEYLKNLLGA
jgi:hypothetical protein